MNNDGGFKRFQDFEPVTLTKKKTNNSVANEKSKSNIHLVNKTAIDNEELPKIIYYTTDQLNQIKNLRELCDLNQEQASMIFGGSVKKDFFNKIESNKLKFDQTTFNTIIRTLNNYLKNKNRKQKQST
uniref:Uncharacterized protein n=1 Tax=viral metagenome TaxID=1070528 RepID=A0A6C0CF30_9ZZZZ